MRLQWWIAFICKVTQLSWWAQQQLLVVVLKYRKNYTTLIEVKKHWLSAILYFEIYTNLVQKWRQKLYIILV